MTKRKRAPRFELRLSPDGLAIFDILKNVYRKEASIIIEKALFQFYQTRKEEILKITNDLKDRIEDDIFMDRMGGW